MLKVIYGQSKIKEIAGGINKVFYGLNDPFLVYSLAYEFNTFKQNILVVCPNLYEAQKYYDKLGMLCDKDDVLFYPVDHVLTTMMAITSPEFKNERLYTIKRLIEKKKNYIIVTTHLGLNHNLLSPQDYSNSYFTLEKNKEYDLNKITRILVNNGFIKRYTVESPGEFSLRGSILDIYPNDTKNPYRFDFFGDELETIKEFDVQTQKSISIIDKVTISPMSELFYNEKILNEAISKIKLYKDTHVLSSEEESKLNLDIESLLNRQNLDKCNIYTKFFTERKHTILDFIGDYKANIINLNKTLINEDTQKEDLNAYQLTVDGDFFVNLFDTTSINDVKFLSKNTFYMDLLPDDISNCTNLEIGYLESFNQSLEHFYKFIEAYKGFTVVIGVKKDLNHAVLKEYFDNKKLKYSLKVKPNEICLIKDDLMGSFVNKDEKLLIINEETIFNTKLKTRVQYRSVINQATKIRDVNELNENDYVVHYDYGIGKYKGLKTLDLNGLKRDYLYLEYLNGETLYVPVDKIDLVLKYKSHEGFSPKLSKLGGKQWTNTKNNLKQKIKDLSDRLLKLYSLRNHSKGFKFSTDNQMQQALENDFIYEETIDQQQAIVDVKKDMESEKPMDRLIAGDVGFGKTEVALRASFKAILDGKQVCYLVPTTILARQHYYTFKERMEKYGVNVALLSRFVSNKEQTLVIDKLKNGLIDVVIGTHRVLSKDILFKDLGLFIIDEEQRFGVEHKEKIKEIKVNVDTLTLSATPIPRTIQMSLYGLKDLTAINTPPENRYPVQTYVVARQDALIKEAINREVARGGQVYYLYNNVTDMDKIVIKLSKLVPNARICFAHGKMSKDKLEDVLTDFIDHNYDVLVATTIIETGVDIPNSNTLIIHDADKLGLSQLYQIRGRVGRSDKIAYAYLMYDRYKDLSDEALKRLKAINDFTELGSGFKVALRDLSIRGAGDLLGDSQSGFIDSVGIDLYMKLLDEVNHGADEKEEILDQVYSQRHIPKEYIDDDVVRIEIHKRIAVLNSVGDLVDLKDELVDRFGKLSDQMVTYMYEKLFKKLSAKLGVEKVLNEKNSVTLIIGMEKSKEVNGEKLFEFVSKSSYPIRLGYIKGRVNIILSTTNSKDNWMVQTVSFVEEYLKFIEK